jgi:hypothetical protein
MHSNCISIVCCPPKPQPHSLHSLAMIRKLPGATLYDAFAYDLGVLHFFVNAEKNAESYWSLTGSYRQFRHVRGGDRHSSRTLTGSHGSFLDSLGGSFGGMSLFGKKRHGTDSSGQSGSFKLAKGDSSAKENSNSRGRRALKFETRALRRSKSQ